MANKKDKKEPRVNYLKQINAFWDRVIDYPLKPSSSILWFYLVNRNNRLDWREQITIDHENACQTIGIAKNTYYECRKELIAKGYIKLEPAVNRAFIDKITIKCLYPISVTAGGKDSETEAEQKRESAGNLDKPINPNSINENSESENKESFAPSSFDEFSSFFLNLIKEHKQKWGAPYVKVQAEKCFKHFNVKGWLIDWKTIAEEWIVSDNKFISVAASSGSQTQISGQYELKNLMSFIIKYLSEHSTMSYGKRLIYDRKYAERLLDRNVKAENYIAELDIFIKEDGFSKDGNNSFATVIGSESAPKSLIPTATGPRMNPDERSEQ